MPGLARFAPLLPILLAGLLAAMPAQAVSVLVVDRAGKPVPGAMVTLKINPAPPVDTSDNGYPRADTIHLSTPDVTRFTDAKGQAGIAAPTQPGSASLRVRKPGYRDATATVPNREGLAWITLEPETNAAALAAAKPANLWLNQLNFEGFREQETLRQHFLLHCAFCHQQGAAFTRKDRSAEEWLAIIDRMNRYGAQLAWDFRKPLAEYLAEANRQLQEHHRFVPPATPWGNHLKATVITEWPLGDGFSQLHDFLLHPNGLVYVGDNLMDRLYALDPGSGRFRVYKVPHPEGARLGGILPERLKEYPKAENYSGIHSLAASPLDGHIFITPSMQQMLLEFDPETGQFTMHPMDEGFYPHTIRVDAKDRVWFTLALSSQVGMLDRATGKFTFYDLPPRGFKERVTLAAVKRRLGSGDPGEPPKYDLDNMGFPMPYGIDVSPVDGSVWVTRLYADDLARIDPESGEVRMIKTPFKGPRRLRCDAEGKVWITGFATGNIASYDPATEEFTQYPLPVLSETPYALNVDRARGIVWVNGNQSDTILAMEIKSGKWKIYPMSRRQTFTRDIEIAKDGSVYTSNSHFPGWMIEDGQPTLIRITND